MKFGNECLEDAFKSPREIVSNAAIAIAEAGINLGDFDTLVGTGFSGALVVPILGQALGKDFLLVRKPGDSHHHGTAVAEGNFNDSGKWIFVDDGIASGTTYDRVRNLVRKLAVRNALPDEFKGAYLYGHERYDAPEFWRPELIQRQLGLVAA